MDVSIISNILLKIHPKVCTTEHLIYSFFSHITSYLGIIPLDQVDVRVLGAEGGERSWQFEIYNVGGGEARDTVKGCKLDRGGTVVMGHHKVYRWVAVVSLVTTRAVLLQDERGHGGGAGRLGVLPGPRHQEAEAGPAPAAEEGEAPQHQGLADTQSPVESQ